MNLKAAVLSVLIATSLAACADEKETYVLQSPSAPVAEANLEIKGETAKLTVRYTDGSTATLAAVIQRNESSPQTFKLDFNSLPPRTFEFNTIPQLKTGILKCAECLDMSAVKGLEPSTSLVEWKRAAEA